MKSNTVIPLILMSFITPVVNAETANAAPLNAGTLLQTIFGLMIVLAIIVLLGWMLKRSQYFHTTHHGQLKVLGALSLGNREKAVLVQVGKQQLLLGVTPHQVRTLHLLTEPLMAREKLTSAEDDSFADRLKQMMQRSQK